MTIIEIGAGIDLPIIRRLGEAFLTEPTTYKTTLIRINIKDMECNAFGEVKEIDETNVDSIAESNESKKEFIANLPKRREDDRDNSIEQIPLVINMKTGGLEGIKLIYDAVKEYSPIPL